ncbi:MAG: hypothetical protein K2J32_02970 [Ruminococcus sp.]|nr:hypothetical protein [Ruminococcus sp.]
MKKIKKLTAFVASLMLAVGAVPANIYAAEAYSKVDPACDWDNSGYVGSIDGFYFINYLEYIENRPITDFSMYDIDIENYIKSEGGIEEVTKKRDMNGDGVIDKWDFVIFSLLSRKAASSFLIDGDVNLDGAVDAVDGYMIKYYFEGYDCDVYNGYSSLKKLVVYYGDANEDGVVDMTDADFILSGEYAERVNSYFASISSNSPVAQVSFDEYMNDTSDSGDVNHDGFVDARDATLISLYYAYLSTCSENEKDDHKVIWVENEQRIDLTDDYNAFYDYTEEQTENMYTYGDVNKDGYVNALDASLIMTKYARNSTQG